MTAALTPEREAIIRRMFTEGATDEEISAAIGIKRPSTTQRLRARLGPLRSQVHEKVQDSQAIREMHANLVAVNHEAPTRAVAEVFGVSRRTVRRHIGPGGVTTPLPAETLAQAKALLEDRTGYIETARTVGCHPETLRRRFPGMGMNKSEIANVRAAHRLEEKVYA